jgi:hypothetical protein
MSNTYGVNASNTVSYSTGFDAGMSTVSPDSLLAYCQMQLGDLDGQINDQMTAQETALREREAVQSAQSVLGQFGTAGPTKPADMRTCLNAVDNAAAQLPADDPVAKQLSDFRAAMVQEYGDPGRDLTPDEQSQLADATTAANAAIGYVERGLKGTVVVDQSSQLAAQATVKSLNDTQNGTFVAPNAATQQWQGTTAALDNVTKDITSSAEIQMLKLQDLVSQRQQAIQLCSGIMSKTDQTLEDQAKAIGQG